MLAGKIFQTLSVKLYLRAYNGNINQCCIRRYDPLFFTSLIRPLYPPAFIFRGSYHLGESDGVCRLQRSVSAVDDEHVGGWGPRLGYQENRAGDEDILGVH